MSYARFCEGDVYVIATEEGFECMCCGLEETPRTFLCETHTDMIKHLTQHREAGHTVPTDAFERLEKELMEAKG